MSETSQRFNLNKLKNANWRKLMITTLGVVAVLGGLWYAIWGLHPYQVDQQQIALAYAHQHKAGDNIAVAMEIEQETKNQFTFTYSSFDGAIVNGRMVYPDNIEPGRALPVMLGVHAMGRSENRWWMDSFKERPTLEQTDKLTQQALANGYAVIAIDSRNHGKRKNLDHNIIEVMNDLHWWGKREPYEQMVIDTVKDYRVLLDWVEQQPQFDATKTTVAGYSMGGQVSLLLAGVDDRIERVLSIVPPYLDDKVAIVAPKNILGNLAHLDKLWLVSANDDEHASESENADLYALIKTKNKKHVRFEGGHVLPTGYYQQLSDWYQ